MKFEVECEMTAIQYMESRSVHKETVIVNAENEDAARYAVEISGEESGDSDTPAYSTKVLSIKEI